MRASLLLQAMARGFLGRRRHRRTLSQKAELIAREDARRAEEIRCVRTPYRNELTSVVTRRGHGLEASQDRDALLSLRHAGPIPFAPMGAERDIKNYGTWVRASCS